MRLTSKVVEDEGVRESVVVIPAKEEDVHPWNHEEKGRQHTDEDAGRSAVGAAFHLPILRCSLWCLRSETFERHRQAVFQQLVEPIGRSIRT